MKSIWKLYFVFGVFLICSSVPLESAEIDLSYLFGLSSHSVDRGDISVIDGVNSMEIKFDGDITIANDDRSVKSISPGGYLNFSIRTFGNKRELTVTSNRSGQLEYEYFEGRTEVPFEPGGRAWMEDVLIDVVRSSGIDASGRANRIYGQKGLEGFLEEMGEISSNSVKGSYFRALLREQTLGDQELKAIAESITRTISSNSERGRLFRENSDLFLQENEVAVSYLSAASRLSSNSERGRIYRNISRKLDFTDPVLVDAYFQGVDRLSSDAERGSILRHTIHTQDLYPYVQVNLFRSVSRISSNSESGRVIRTLETVELQDRDVAIAFFNAIDRISSSSEKSMSLRHVLDRSEISGDVMQGFLNSTRKISSDSETSSVLRSIKEIDLAGDPAVREAYFSTVGAISSSSEKGRTLRYALDQHSMNANAQVALLEVTARLSSNTEKSMVLRHAIPKLVYKQRVLDAFFAAVNATSSSSEQGRILRAMVTDGKPENNVIRGVLDSAGRISSNSEKGAVLRAVAPKIDREDDELRKLYLETARTLSSDSEFRRATEVIF